MDSQEKEILAKLRKKSDWVRIQTLLIHRNAPETRVASSLSNVETFVTLYHGGILKFNPKEPYDESRDRFVISKGHGSISMYPLLADLGFFPLEELQNVCKEGSFLGGIPDPIVPGYETVNGSLGHGLGVSCGMALGLRAKKSTSQVFVMVGDGEINEGANWEAIMLAAHHKLDNLTLIIDNNRVSMLDYSKNIIDLDTLQSKFEAFKFHVEVVDGHDVGQLYPTLQKLKAMHIGKPKVLIANTVKGKGSPTLEGSSLSHILALKTEEIDSIIEGIQ
ncbi:MAG: transketolase [Spirochaetota bacterium]